MTQELMYIDAKGSIYFDCRNHAGLKDVCIMVSTLCNVLIVACGDLGITPRDDEDGHLCFDITDAPEALIQTFRWVQKVFDEIEAQFPENLRIYCN